MFIFGGKKIFFFTYGTNQRQVKRVVSTKKSTIHVKFHQNWYIKYSLKKNPHKLDPNGISVQE